jgi:glycosyltransferase involved in cell wall biosynthesis
MIKGRDIIFISSIEWGFLWQGHQEIALRLARAGNRVLYIENTGVRSPGLKDFSRVTARLKRWWKAFRSSGARAVAPNLHVCSPLVMPPFGSRFRRVLNRGIFLPAIKRAARQLKMRDPIIWTYLPTDTACDLIKLLRDKESAIVYYVGADFDQLVPDLDRLRKAERAVIDLSDVIITNCSTLTNRYSPMHKRVHTFPFGVDLSAFQSEKEESEISRRALHLLSKVEELKRPVIGYVGGLHRHVDFSLLAESAKAKPDWSWVFVGPVQSPVGELENLPNVHFAGQQPHEELVHFVRRFDVCIVPYLNNAFTATVVPVKLNEYLAVGKPVVSTSIPMVCEFNEKHKVILTCENTKADFLSSIETYLNKLDDASAIEYRKKVASFSEWQTRLEAICEAVDECKSWLP